MMTTSTGTVRIELEAHDVNIRANDVKGETTVEIIGGSRPAAGNALRDVLHEV